MKSTIALSQTAGRIESLDVLRSFVLLGILIVHCNNGFGFLDSTPMSGISGRFHWLYHMFLEGKCNIAFVTLFGASFGLILRNKKNTSMRFLWRCLLLAGFGVINKFFYWYDALMLFGLGGMMIIPFRYMRTRAILIVTIGLYVLTPLVWPLINAGSTIFHNWVPADPPEVATTSFSEILHRPLWEGIKTYAYAVTIHGGVLRRFFFMGMGFLFVRSNMVYHIQDYLKRKWLVILWVFTLIAILWQFYGQWPYPLDGYKGVANMVACLTYCYTVLYVYYGGG